MNKMFYIIRLMKINKNTYRIVLKKNNFFEVLGSYRPGRGSQDFGLAFLDKDRLFFWLSKGAGCELSAYKFLKIFLLENNI